MNTIGRVAGRWLPRISMVVTVLSYAWLTYLVAQLYLLLTAETPQPVAGEMQVFDPVIGIILSVWVMGLLIVAIVATYLFLPGFVAALIALPAALTWRRPIRVLVLRHFGMTDASRALRRTLLHKVCPAGHVYTLADRDITVPWYVRYPIVFTQLVFLHFRQRQIRSRASIERFLKFMDVGWARNVNWFVSRWKTFALRCDDEHWPALVTALADKVDTIIIEVSRSSENLDWEVRQCATPGLLPKTIFLTRAQYVGDATALLRSQGVDESNDSRLIIYDTDDVERLPGLLPEPRRKPAGQKNAGRLRTHLAAVVLMLGPFIWVVALLAGLQMSGGGDPDPWAEQNRFAALVEQAQDPATHREALGNLSAMILEATPTRPHIAWREDFEEAVLPLYRDLWHTKPGHRRQILTDIRQAGSAAAADLWRNVLADAQNFDTVDLELALTGIVGAEATENVPDLVRLLGEVSGEHRALVVAVLASLGDHRAVPTLLETADAGSSNAWPVADRRMAQQALRKILLAHEPVRPHRVIDQDTGLPRFISIGLGAPQHGRTKLAVGIGARLMALGLLQTNVQDGEVPNERLYDDLDTPMIINAYVSTRPSIQTVIDFPGHVGFYRGLVEYGDRLDAAILVVSVAEGVVAVTSEHVRLAAEVGIPRMAVFLHTDELVLGSPRIAQVEQDIVDLLAENGYTEGNYFVAAGAIPTTVEEAMNDQISAGIDNLLVGLHRWPLRSGLDEQPFRFPVAGSYEIPGRGTLVIGYVEQGTQTIGQRLDVVGHSSNAQVIVEGTYDVPGMEELTGLWVNHAGRISIRAGDVLAARGTLDASWAFTAYVYFLSPEDGGPPNLISVIPTEAGFRRRGVFQLGASLSFYFRASVVYPSGDMSFTYSPDISTAQFNLEAPIPLHRGQRFRIIGEDRRIIGSGIVADILE